MNARAVAILLGSTAFGAAAIYWLVPGPVELAAMKAREGQYRDARAEYEVLLNERGTDRSIVLPLTEIYIGQGEDARAVELLRVYLAEHDNDPVVARRLADILRDNQREAERIAVLEDIARRTNDPDVWRELESLYDIYGSAAQRAEALSALIETGQADAGQMMALARYLAARGDREAALALHARALHEHPSAATLDAVQFHVALALANDRRDLAEQVIAAWNVAHLNVGDTLMLSGTLESIGAPDLAQALIRGSDAFRRGDVNVRFHALRLGALAGDQNASFEELLAWAMAGGLPPEGYGLIVETGGLLGRQAEVFSVLPNIALDELPADEQLAALELATEFSRRDLLDAWRAEAGDDWMGLPPLTAARLALSVGETQRAAELATIALEQAATYAETANAARTLAVAGLRDTATATVRALAARHAEGALAADALEPLADAALRLGLNAIALAAAEDLAQHSNRPYSQVLHARALTANGRANDALGMLERFDPRDPAIESALVTTLLAAHQRERLQMLLYERLADPGIPRERRSDLLGVLIVSTPLRAGANGLVPLLVEELRSETLTPPDRHVRVRALALIDQGAAVPFADALADATLSDEIILHATLLKRAGRDAEAIARLTVAAARTPADRSGFVESLIALAGLETALPLLSQLAEAEGGDWRFAYEDALRQLGDRETLAAVQMRHAQDPSLPVTERRNLAYSLLDLGHKEDAERIFQALATGEGPQSADAQSLSWLWGPRPEPEQIAWMLEQARGAEPGDQAGWITRVLEAGAPDEAARLADELLAGSDDAALLEAAVRARITLNDRVGVERLLTSALPRFNDAATAERFARHARAVGAEAVASRLYERAAEIDPTRNETRGLAGVTAYQGRDITRARTLLEEYVGRGGTNAEAAYSLAEIRFQDGDLLRARTGYEAVIAAAEARPGDPLALRLKALSLLRLKREGEAIETYDRLLALSPSDNAARADAGAALLDAGRVNEAARVLSYGMEDGARLRR